MINFGAVPAGSVLPIFFPSYDSDGASVTLSGLAVTDIEIYKGVSLTQRSSDAGYTLLDTDGIDIESMTGINAFSIDTGDNTDAGFYAAGSFYTVVVSAVTIDTQTVNFVAATFRIVAAESSAGTPKADVSHWLGTAAATPTVAGVPEVDVTHWIGTAAATPTTAGVPEVDITHVAGSAVSTSSAQLGVNVVNAGGTAWASGSLTSGVFASGAITATAIATDAIGAAEIADGAITAATFAAGAIDATAIATDAIDADAIADGAITSGVFAAGAITASAIAADAIGASELAADAVAEIADQVWDEILSGHAVSGSTGEALSAAGGAGDPWITSLPGSYSSGQAGYILGTNVNATVSSRASQTSVDDLPTNAELATSQASADDATLAAIAALNNLSAAQVNAEVVDALATDTYAEPGQGTPTATTTLAAKINYLYKAWRNKKEQTATTHSLYNDAGNVVDQKSTVSDDSTTATRGKIATGP